MSRDQWNRLRRCDVVKVGHTIRVIQFGPADYRYRDGRPGLSVDFGKVVRTGYPSAVTTYQYADIGKRTVLLKHAPHLLKYDMERIQEMGWNSRSELARELRRWKEWEARGTGTITSVCRERPAK